MTIIIMLKAITLRARDVDNVVYTWEINSGYNLPLEVTTKTI